MAGSSSYVPALRFHRLTRLYDPVVRVATRERRFKDRILDQAKLAAGSRVLDLGCGTGTLAIAARLREPEADLVGLDADPAILERARVKAESAGVSISLDEGFSDRLPYPDASFDRVLSTLFFHHIGADVKRATASEVARVLKPGGELHVADFGPPSDPLMALLSLTIRLGDGLGPTRDNFKGNLPAIFTAAGLEEVSMRGRIRTMFGSIAFLSASRP